MADQPFCTGVAFLSSTSNDVDERNSDVCSFLRAGHMISESLPSFALFSFFGLLNFFADKNKTTRLDNR